MLSSNVYMKSYMSLIKEDVDGVENDGSENTDNIVKVVCFKTSDPTLIDIINSGFDKVVFSVKAKDEDGEDKVEEVELTPESFADFTVKDFVEDGDKSSKEDEDGETVTEEDEEEIELEEGDEDVE